MTLIRRIMSTHAPSAVVLIRLMVGAVFLSEGIQKFLFPADPDRGAARFAKIGFAQSDFTASFVACFEVTCGTLILVGLLTRLVVIPTITIMVVAIWTTKVPILQNKGFWEMAHAVRTDFAMLLGSLFLLLVGAGPWSLDTYLWSRPNE
jgi:putative oxidoreductase